MREELRDRSVGREEEIAPPAYLQQLRAIAAPPQAVVDQLILQLGGTPITGSGRPLGPQRTSGPGADQRGDAAAARSAIVLPPVPEGVAGPWLLGQVHEALLAADQRTARGAWFTPPALARALVTAAGAVAPRRVLDPSCGGGAFLLAAREAFGEIHLAGRDIDPLAVEVTRAALGLAGATDVEVRHADGLAVSDGQYDLVVGNPPFLSQLRGATARDEGRRQMVLGRFGAAAGGYVDEAGLFLLATATESLAPGGVAVLIVPEALLATAAAARLRREISRHCTVEVVWRDRERIFPQTPTCAVRLVRRAAVTAVAAAHAGWSHLLADDVPHVTLAAGLPTIGDIATATADFRDAYYLLVDHVGEDSGEEDGHRLVPVGLIDPAHLRWGQSEVRFGKRVWQRPVATGLPADFLDRRLGTKVLVATQSRVIEALVDATGDLLPSTPVITVRTAWPWHVGAALTSPVLTAVAARRHAGAARSRQALKLSAKQVLALPLPSAAPTSDRRPRAARRAAGALPQEEVLRRWDVAAEAFRAAHDATDPARRRQLLERCGRAMASAHGIHDEALIAWWLDRLPSR